MNSKIHLRKNSSNEYFKTISHYFVFFFFAAFAEVQVAVLLSKKYYSLSEGNLGFLERDYSLPKGGMTLDI